MQKIYEETLKKVITSDDLLGKDVIDSGGEFIGIVENVYIDPISIEILGISIDKGFLKKGLEIGKTYIEKITPNAIFLKIRPVFRLKGRIVFDSEGKKLGKISKVILKKNKNQIQCLVIKSRFKEITISSELINTIGRNVILNINKKNLDKINSKQDQ